MSRVAYIRAFMGQIRQDARIWGEGGQPNFGNVRISGTYGPPAPLLQFLSHKVAFASLHCVTHSVCPQLQQVFLSSTKTRLGFCGQFDNQWNRKSFERTSMKRPWHKYHSWGPSIYYVITDRGVSPNDYNLHRGGLVK